MNANDQATARAEKALRAALAAAGHGTDGDAPRLAGPIPPGTDPGELAATAEREVAQLTERGSLVLWAPGHVPDEDLAVWRNAVWPRLHATSIVALEAGGAKERTLSGRRALDAPGAEPLTALVTHRREWVQSPEATVEKFDKNAIGWNGEPGKPGYAHFRWMRRYVGCFARPRPGYRVLDFGCGAGWCGIESVAGVEGVALRAFDPSPEMVRIATENAQREGVADFEARTGFGDAPPFPQEGEERFDLVISSGVVSFAPSVEGFLEGLASTLKPGGTLVFGDINVESRGFRARRRRRPLLPVRELNAQSADDMRARLEERGFHHHETAGYQLTWPVPEAMHYSERRLGGVLSVPLLVANRALAGLDRATGHALNAQFDSWVMRLTAPRFMGVTTGTPDSKYVYDEDGTRHLRADRGR